MKNARRFGVSAVLIMVLVFGITALMDVAQYKREVAAMDIGKLDLSGIADGTYTGGCDVGLVSARVTVTLKNHSIKDITLVEHKHGKGSAAEVIPGRVLEAQSLDVDVVSGATSSSKVILKAIENALDAPESTASGF